MFALALLAWLSPAHAETTAYVSFSGALGFLLENMGDFAVGVEQRLGQHHGVLLEGTFIHVHGDPTHATTYGAQLGYRYHFEHAFLGLVAGYEMGGAKYFIAEHGGPYDAFSIRHLSLVPHLGYRWDLGEHLAVTARFGAGLGSWEIQPEGAGTEAEAQLLRDRLQFTPVKLDSELSLGWRF